MEHDSHTSLEEIASNAFIRFGENLRAALPNTAQQIFKFLRGVPPLSHPELVLSSPTFPHYVLPYWLSPARERANDEVFQTDMIYSTLSGSYSIRLCDNIADNDCPSELRKFAPCAAYFDSEFIRPYMKYFQSGHKFWSLFDRFWAQQAEASSADALLHDVDDEAFSQISSKKFTATKIPIAAVFYRYEELDNSVERWFRFVDLLGSFTQFNNDFFDWNHDELYKITTYVSSQARRRAPGESLAGWFLREGFDWGTSVLHLKFDAVRMEAELLGNREVLDWVVARGHALERDLSETRSGLELVRTFGKIISEKSS